MPPVVLVDGDDLAAFVGSVVTLRGVVTRTKVPTLCGVDVDAEAFAGRAIEATGTLVASSVTADELDALIARVGQVAHRGPGTTYQLVDATYRAIVDVVALRPFVPASDLGVSLRFFGDLGFTTTRIDDGLALVQLGPFSFLLQQYEAKGFAANFMMQVVVDDLDGWWERIEALDLAGRYAVKPPTAPARQPWGLTVAYVVDPGGVLWHFVQKPS